MERLDEIRNLYTSLAMDILLMSVDRQDSVKQLKERIQGSIVTMTGPSGVGKKPVY